VFQELTPPEGLVSTESFDDFPGESLNTVRLSEADGKEVCDAVLASGMQGGAAERVDRLDEYLRATA